MFFEKVKMTDTCWLWTGNRCKYGYGKTKRNKKYVNTHRLLYFDLYPEVDRKFLICYHCDTPHCVRPSHLFHGTAKDNVQDMIKKGRGARQKITHCPSGHPYSKENTYITPSTGGRCCRICIKRNNDISIKIRSEKRKKIRDEKNRRRMK